MPTEGSLLKKSDTKYSCAMVIDIVSVYYLGIFENRTDTVTMVPGLSEAVEQSASAQTPALNPNTLKTKHRKTKHP